MEVFLTVREVASALRVSPQTVGRLHRSGNLHAVHVGRQIRIAADAIAQFLSQNESEKGGDK